AQRISFADDLHPQRISVIQEEDNRLSRTFRRDDTYNSTNRERSHSPSDDSIEADNIPHADTYQITISSAKAQLDMQSSLLDSLLTILPSPTSPESRQTVLAEAFKKSLIQMQNL